jgi:hypothetical protein
MVELDRGEVGVALIQNAPGALLGIGILDQNADTLHSREVPDNLAVEPRDGFEFPRPIRFLVRPGEPGGGVRLPFSGHAETERARGWPLRRY